MSTSAAVAISQAFCAVSVRDGFFSAMAAMAWSMSCDISPARVATKPPKA